MDEVNYWAILEEKLLEPANDFILRQKFTFQKGKNLTISARATMKW